LTFTPKCAIINIVRVQIYRVQKGILMTIQELEVNETQAKAGLESAIKDFEAQRGTASIVDLGKLANAVTTATRKAESAIRELADFALVGIYEAVKVQIEKLGDKLLHPTDVATLLEKQVSMLSISVPLSADGLGTIVVNTLGRKTRVASTGGNGTRARWEMRCGSESMECRAFLESDYGLALGEHKDGGLMRDRVLAEPARYGLSDYAARAGAKCDPVWERVKKDD
jgi:hypothetical protein